MFVFKFEKLLNIKSKLLDDKRMKIAALERRIADLEDKRVALINENKRRRNKIFEILNSDRPDKNMVVFLSELVQKSEGEIADLEGDIQKLEVERDRLMDEARELLKEKKKLEKLKEKQFEEYKINLARSEMRFLDDIASIETANRIIINNG